jgi:hypothetical protein
VDLGWRDFRSGRLVCRWTVSLDNFCGEKT